MRDRVRERERERDAGGGPRARRGSIHKPWTVNSVSNRSIVDAVKHAGDSMFINSQTTTAGGLNVI